MATPGVSTVTVAPTRPVRTTSTSSTIASSQQASPGQSRRVSSVMGPPPVPHNTSLPSSPRPPNAAMMETSVSPNDPIRHPRPMTAADLHLEMEKEQESIVNRLTRELSALRAQTVSVASTASSASDLFTTSHTLPEHSYISSSYGTGANSIIPTSSRRHRSSSNLSNRSARSAREGIARDANATSVSGVAAPRDSERDRSHHTSARQSLDIQRPETSRQNSYNLGLATSTSTGSMGMYRSLSNSTSPHGPAPTYTSAGTYGHSHRPTTSASHSRDPSQQGPGQGTGLGLGSRSPSFTSTNAARRYEEAAVQRQELEAVKKENDALKQKIRDLERQLSAGGSDSVAATTS